jgi:hypothetical protein
MILSSPPFEAKNRSANKNLKLALALEIVKNKQNEA